MMGNRFSIMVKRGDIVLVPFPFIDLTGKKVGPAVVISVKNNIDVSVAFISSVIPAKLSDFDFLLSTTNPDFSKTGLKKRSVFKMNKVLTLDRSKILRRLGRVSPSISKRIDAKLKSAFGIE
jgi:mRNA interferase MazF